MHGFAQLVAIWSKLGECRWKKLPICLEFIIKFVEEWALDHYGTDTEGNWNDWTFQQDSAPSHASVNENKEKFKVPTQTWLNDHFPDFKVCFFANTELRICSLGSIPKA